MRSQPAHSSCGEKEREHYYFNAQKGRSTRIPNNGICGRHENGQFNIHSVRSWQARMKEKSTGVQQRARVRDTRINKKGKAKRREEKQRNGRPPDSQANTSLTSQIAFIYSRPFIQAAAGRDRVTCEGPLSGIKGAHSYRVSSRARTRVRLLLSGGIILAQGFFPDIKRPGAALTQVGSHICASFWVFEVYYAVSFSQQIQGVQLKSLEIIFILQIMNVIMGSMTTMNVMQISCKFVWPCHRKLIAVQTHFNSAQCR